MEKKNKKEFSKVLLIQESALIWIMSLSFIILAFYCIYKGFTGSLPWLAAMVGFPWTAYGISQVKYYSKSEKENTKDGIKYETILTELKQKTLENLPDAYYPEEEDMSGVEMEEEIIDLDYGI